MTQNLKYLEKMTPDKIKDNLWAMIPAPDMVKKVPVMHHFPATTRVLSSVFSNVQIWPNVIAPRDQSIIAVLESAAHTVTISANV